MFGKGVTIRNCSRSHSSGLVNRHHNIAGNTLPYDSARLGLLALHEVHGNTMEGFWSLLRSWLRPHRGISQEKLPLYLGFFQFVHNTRKRGKALLGALVGTLVA
jgi:transposase-like protein